MSAEIVSLPSRVTQGVAVLSAVTTTTTLDSPLATAVSTGSTIAGSISLVSRIDLEDV